MVYCSILYEDESALNISATEWPVVRSDGVQEVRVSANGYSVVFQAASFYWLYPEGEHFVAGCGSVRYDPNPLTEVLVFADGRQEERRVEFMPDLRHEQVKLGWWKHG